MSEIVEEPDYLAGTQLAIDPDSFVQAVKEAFLLEHNCRENQEIAAVVGVDKSRISQIFKTPTNLQASSVRDLIAPLNAEHRKRILRAWNKECFGVDVFQEHKRRLVGAASTANALRRVDRKVRMAQLREALQVALEAVRQATDETEIEMLLDRIYFLYQRLDLPGASMKYIHLIATRAQERKETRRLAQGHLYQIRVLAALPNCKPEEIEPIFKRVEELLRGQPPIQAPLPPYGIAKESTVNTLRFGTYLTFAERGTITADPTILSKQAEVLTTALKRKLSRRETVTGHQTLARIYYLLGDDFLAQEHIDMAFKASDMKTLSIVESSMLLQGRVFFHTGRYDEACDYLLSVSNSCLKANERYYHRLAEYDLARAWSARIER